MQNTISETVRKYIAEFFSVPVDQITAATVADDHEGWDSMANAEIILGLEDALGAELEPEDLFELNNVGSLIEIFEKRVGS